METDADRLASIKALGGVLVRASAGDFWAIFDREFVSVDIGLPIESRGPALTCRTSDVYALTKDSVVQLDRDYRVKQLQPELPAPGWTIIFLKN
jgi:hypothetical protein